MNVAIFWISLECFEITELVRRRPIITAENRNARSRKMARAGYKPDGSCFCEEILDLSLDLSLDFFVERRRTLKLDQVFENKRKGPTVFKRLM